MPSSNTNSKDAVPGLEEDPSVIAGKVLLNGIISGKPIASIVDPLVADCKDSADCKKCLAIILNMVLNVAGVSESVSSIHFEDDSDVQTTLEEVLVREKPENMVCLLTAKDGKLRRLRKSYQEFFSRLVQSAHNAELLGDDSLLGELRVWLSAMNESKARTFRYTAAVALFGCLDGITEVMITTESSLRAVTKKKDATNLIKRREVLQNISETLFTCSVHNRIKDVASDIRLIAMEKLRQCFFALPSVYLDNTYFRYLRVGLHDSKPENRAEALETLFSLLSNLPGAPEKLIAFMTLCIDRIVEMCKDVDTKCVYNAIKVCTVIIKHNLTKSDGTLLISNDQLDAIFGGLLDDRNVIRFATGTFLKVFINSKVEEMQATSHPKASLLTALVHSQAMHLDGFSEELIIDALWKKEDPPDMLTEFKPYIELCTSEEVDEAVAGLRLVAALLRRFSQEDCNVGPAPKDDLALSVKSKGKGDTSDTLERLHIALSDNIIETLPDILEDETRKNTARVIIAVSDIFANLHYKNGKASSPIKQVVNVFQECCLQCTMEVDEVMATSNGWRKIAFFGDQKAALNSFLKEVLVGVSKDRKAEEDLNAYWSRLMMLSSLVALPDKWDLFVSTLEKSSIDASLFHQQYCASSACFYSILWDISRNDVEGSNSQEDISLKLDTIVPMMLVIVQSDPSEKVLPVLRVKAKTLVYVMDLLCLPQTKASDDISAQVVLGIGLVIGWFNEVVSELQCQIRIALSKMHEGTENTHFVINQLRASLTEIETLCAKVISSCSRLFLLEKIADTMAPNVLALWTMPSFKSSNDIFKGLFHALRDKSGGDGFTLEKNTVLHALNSGDVLNPDHIAYLHTIGTKLASMHFTITDKHYGTCYKMVQFGYEYAANNNEVILALTAPYCCKLRRSDALSLAQKYMSNPLEGKQDIAVVTSFMSAICRAAKIADANPKPPASKRSRTSVNGVDEDVAAALRLQPSSPNGRFVEDSDGWRGKTPGQRDIESIAADSGTTLVATQEWE